MASNLLRNVDPAFTFGTNVLTIKYKSGDPNQAALIANAFHRGDDRRLDRNEGCRRRPNRALVRAAARRFAKELEAARSALEHFQSKTNIVAPGAGGDSETSEYMSITDELSAL